jgi:integrase
MRYPRSSCRGRRGAAPRDRRRGRVPPRPEPELDSDRGSVSANLAVRVLRAVWNHAALTDPTLGPNPVKLPRAWYAEPRRERVVPKDRLPEFYRAIEAVPNAIARDYLKLVLTTGLRLSEAASLRWDDITLPDPKKRTHGVASDFHTAYRVEIWQLSQPRSYQILFVSEKLQELDNYLAPQHQDTSKRSCICERRCLRS